MKALRLILAPIPLMQLFFALRGYQEGISHQNWGYRAAGWNHFYCWGIAGILEIALLAVSVRRPLSDFGLFLLFVCIVLTIWPFTMVF
jgi:hypothetical protein